MDNNSPLKVTAAAELIDDLTLQLFEATAEIEYISEHIATTKHQHDHSHDLDRRYAIRQQLRILHDAFFFSNMRHVSLQNNRELAYLRYAKWRETHT